LTIIRDNVIWGFGKYNFMNGCLRTVKIINRID
jgi:hypothetical protein